jgi:hypothetical protein
LRATKCRHSDVSVSSVFRIPAADTNTSTGLRLLAMKTTPIEKFQYLVHLKATNVHLFYRLLSENIKVGDDSGIA